MASPAERYSAARRRGQSPVLADFLARYSFGLDPFQDEACRALEAGRGVLVAAPTGAGKTVVGEFAAHLALQTGRKCFYTTPIKALSNQKYADLSAWHGPDDVGLLTGDNSINGDASVVVMTTEVLRNMLYAGSDTLRGLGYVVMDEVHYLADRFRGAVWEEVIIHLPDDVRLVSLSATVSNAEEFGEWLGEVRGDTAVIVEEHRPVPLWQSMLVGRRLYDLYADDAHSDVNPELLRVAREDDRFGRPGGSRRSRPGDRPRPRRGPWVPARPDVVEELDRAGMLPAITFIFSRQGCDQAVAQCLRAGLRLNSAAEARDVRHHVEQRTRDLPDEDLGVLGYHEWLDGLERGLAAHHAGMLPTFKEVVEELFVRGLVKAVFATETLALGINMPARTVVLERLSKWNGEAHVDITPGEYTQLTGRAGRRGIDVEGHAVVLYTPGVDPKHVAGLASTRTYPLRSSFRPSYNMAVNLVGKVGRHTARELLESSFAQFQADRSVVGLARQVRRNEEALEGYREAMTCDLGDFADYAGLRRRLTDREAELARRGAASRRAEAANALERLRTGDVIRIPAGRRAGLAVVLDPGLAEGLEGPRPTVLTADRQVKKLTVHDFPVPVEPLARVKVPKSFNSRNPKSRRDLVSSMRNTGVEEGTGRPRRQASGAADDPEIARLRAELRAHPCHRCPEREDHARWAERFHRLRRETDALERRVEGRTNTIARTFDRVCRLLQDGGYLDGDTVTPAGAQLARIYNDADLLVAECIRRRLWDGLSAPELAAVVSSVAYEARREEAGPPRLPGGRVRPTLTEMQRLWVRLKDAESDHRLNFLREPDAGFAWAAHRWASGHPLDTVLTETDLPAGDFVRWVKQLLDLLGQIEDVAEEPLRATARAAIRALDRGVVAYSSVG
ncbi:MAG TPA: DEAD/DEAH box helicase [Mycobacteriales bacterium]|nr:DEAD/DEAH box helicase [Mycobacteriales bacterium]